MTKYSHKVKHNLDNTIENRLTDKNKLRKLKKVKIDKKKTLNVRQSQSRILFLSF